MSLDSTFSVPPVLPAFPLSFSDLVFVGGIRICLFLLPQLLPFLVEKKLDCLRHVYTLHLIEMAVSILDREDESLESVNSHRLSRGSNEKSESVRLSC